MSPTFPVFALRLPEAARALGIGESLFKELARTGEIATVKIGRASVYPVDDLTALLERNRVRRSAESNTAVPKVNATESVAA